MRGAGVKRIVFLAVVVSLLASGAFGRSVEERPRIYLEKKVIAEKREGQVRYYEVHRVRKGENLWKIFIEKLGGRPEEFSLFLREFRKSNPDVKNPSKIRAGEKVRLPVSVGTLARKKQLEGLLKEGKLREYRVRKGDSLWKIALADFSSPVDLLRYIEEARKLNPFLKDPDLIFPGQTLYLPTRRYFEKGAVSEAVAKKEVQVPTSSSPLPAEEKGEAETGKERVESVTSPPQEEGAPSGEEEILTVKEEAPAPVKEGGGESTVKESPEEEPEKAVREGGEKASPGEEGVPLPAETAKVEPSEEVRPALPEKTYEPEKETLVETPAAVGKERGEVPEKREEEVVPYAGLLADVLSIMGEKVSVKGQMYFPLAGGGEVVLDMAKFPLVRFSTGKTLVVDPAGALPREVEKVVETSWQGYSLFRGRPDMGAVEFLERVLKEASYFSVKRGSESELSIGNNARVSIEADIIVLKEEDSILKGDVYAVREMKTPEVPEDLGLVYRYAEIAGITVIPFYYDQNLRDGYVLSLPEREPRLEEKERIPRDPVEGAAKILSLLGVRVSKEEKITISGEGGAFTLTVRPDLVIYSGGKPLVFDPERFSRPVIDLIEKKGFRVLTVSRGVKTSSLLVKLLREAGIPYRELVNETLGGGEGRGFRVTVSGILVRGKDTGNPGGKDILFVSGPVDTGLRWLLSDQFGLRVVTYR
ncbi:MAG: LysM peptidoglycan-binding domain-containing protein [Deltaproteobacteria bacterium]|nr:MAG: LysM peptidoglycan-binding domain-containing protein [Deltaproteobacteria bacterium]